jgi:NAD(P)-dependent dehydrogenase (short-subunit alcohol dehydrogenase family)
MSQQLAGKVGVISGGTTGIGLATAQRFAAEGAHVIIFGRGKAQLDGATKAIAHIVRPVFFMENWLRRFGESIRNGQLQQPLSPTANLQMVAVDDIGAFAALAFEHPGTWIDQTFSLVGDELSMQQIADAFSRATAQDVKYVQIPWNQLEQNMDGN